MKCYVILFVFIISLVGSHGQSKKQNTPPHCTQVTKDTDYQSRFKYDYPIAYIQPGQREAYQQLFCVNPPTVNKAVTTVCDWAAPPQVQFTMGDEYMHVVRQDPTGRYLGNAVITTMQLCNHSLVNVTTTVAISTLLMKNNKEREKNKYDFGAHVDGDDVSYANNSFIPPFTPVFTVNVTPIRPDLEKRFTYLRVEYISPMSKVDILFDPEQLVLTFHIRFPFLNVPYGIVGYSVKVQNLRNNLWSFSSFFT